MTPEEFRQRIRARKAQAAVGAVIAPDASPDEAAKAMTLAPETNLPAAAIRLDTTEFEKRIRARRNAETVRQNSALQTYVNENPLHAETSADDFEKLDTWSKLWQAAGPRGFSAGRAEEKTAIAEGLEYYGLGTGADEDAIRQAEAANRPLPWPYRGLQVAAAGLGGAAEDVTAGAVGAGAGAAVGGPVGAGIGLAAGMGFSAYIGQAGRKERELAQLENQTGQKIDPFARRIAITGSATASFVANMLGVQGVAKAGIDDIVSEATQRLVTTPTITRSVARAGKEIGKAGLTGSAIFGVMAGVEGIITDLAKTASDGEWDTFLTDPKRREEIVQSIYTTMIEGGAAMSGLRVPGAGASLVSDLGYIHQARRTAALHDQAVAGAADSATRQRSPEAFRKFAEKVVGDRQIAINIDQIVESGMAEQVKAIVPDFDRQAQVALATGGSIQVPYADYLARVNPEVDAMLREGIVWEPGGLSLKDVEGIEAWHGTPHEFDRFEFSDRTFKTGEGAAVKGAGIYVAGNRAVGEQYAISTAQDRMVEFDFDGGRRETSPYGMMNEITDELGLNDRAAAVFKNAMALVGEGLTAEEAARQTRRDYNYLDRDDIETGSEAFSKVNATLKGKGNLYRVKVRAKPEELLDLDKPINEQDPEVQAKLAQAFSEEGALFDPSKVTMDAGDWVQGMEAHYGNPVEVSRLMREAGIPGSRYLDQGSRSVGDGTRNIVVFDDSRIDILDRNGEPLQGAEREAALAEYGQPEVTREPEQVEGELRATATPEPALATPEGALAADTIQQVAEDTAKELWLQPMFKDAAAAGMTQGEFRRYSQRLEKWTEAVNEKALSAARREVKRRLGVEWKDTAAKVRVDVERELNLQKDFQTYEFLSKGRLVGEDQPVPIEAQIKLDRKAVGNAVLPKGTTTKKNGVHPDEVAELFGFGSGEELVRALAKMEADRAGRPMSRFRRDLIEDEVRQRVEEIHGQLDENIEREAQETALTLVQQDLLAEDLAILGSKIGAPPFEIEAMREWGRQTFADMSLREARNLKEHTRRVGKAGRAAELALLGGDITKAFEAKGNQLVAHILRVEAQKFDREVTRAEKRFKYLGRRSTRPRLDQDHLDQIHGLLRDHGLAVKRKPNELQTVLDRNSLRDFVDSQATNTGGRLVVDPILYDRKGVDLAVAPVQYWRVFRDAIKSLEHNAREAKKVRVGEEEHELDVVVGEITEKLQLIPARFKDGKTDTAMSRLRGAVYTGDSWLALSKYFFDDMDDYTRNGPAERYIMRGLRDGYGANKDLTAEVGKRIGDIQPPKDAKRAVDQRVFREILSRDDTPMTLSRMDYIMVMANMGNEGNQRELIHGFWPETRGDKQAFVDRRDAILDEGKRILRPEDWDYLEKVWDVFEYLWPRIEKASRERDGVAVDKVLAAPFDVGGGRMIKGGYFPIIRDEDRSPAFDKSNQLFDPVHQSMSPWHGYREERKGGGRGQVKIKNVNELLPGRMRQIVYDLTMHDPIVNAHKILSDSRVRDELRRSLGPEYTKQINQFLKDLTNRTIQADLGLEALATLSREARGRYSVAATGLNLAVLLSPSVGNLAKGLVRLSTHPLDTFNQIILNKENHRFAYENSPELRHWAETGYNRNIDDMYSQRASFGSLNDESRWWMKIAYPIKLERMGAVATWVAEYQASIKEGRSETDSIALAEKAVHDHFTRSNPIDLAKIMRTSEHLRTWTAFYQYFSFTYGKARRVAKLTAAGSRKLGRGDTAGARQNFGDAFTDFLTFVVWNSLIGAVTATNAPWDEDDTFAVKAAKFAGGTVAGLFPLVRDVYKTATEGSWAATDHPLIRIAESWVTVGGDVKDWVEGEPDPAWVKHVMNAVGGTTGLPIMGVGRALQFMYDVQRGEENPEGVIEWFRGLKTGNAEKE